MIASTSLSNTRPISASVKFSIGVGTTASAVIDVEAFAEGTYSTVNATSSASNPFASMLCLPLPATTSDRAMICSMASAKLVSSTPVSPLSNLSRCTGIAAITPDGVVRIVQYTTSFTTVGDSTCTVSSDVSSEYPAIT